MHAYLLVAALAAAPDAPAAPATPTVPAAAPADPRAGLGYRLQAKGGPLLPGSVYIEEADVDVDTDAGPLVHLDADLIHVPSFATGAFLLFGSTEAEGVDVSLVTFGVKLKASVLAGPVEIRPGLDIGYTTSEVGGLDEIKGMDLGPVLEVAFGQPGGFRFVGEVGGISQPVGGNDATGVTFAPIVYTALGFEFAG